MSNNYFSGNVWVRHNAREMYNNDLSYSRIGLNEGDNHSVLEFRTIVDNGGPLGTRFPLDATITSAPLLLNFDSFPNQNPNEFVKTFKPFVNPIITSISESLGKSTDRSNCQIEFRISDNQSMSDATEWSSVNGRSYLSQNYQIFDLINDYKSPQSTGDTVFVSRIDSGIRIDATSANSIGHAAYIEMRDGVSGLNSFSSSIGTYLAADITGSRPGTMVEWVAIHDLSDNDDILNVRSPYKHVINIDDYNKEQLVVWDITDWKLGTNRADNIRALGWKVIEGRYGDIALDIKKIRLLSLSSDDVGGIISGVPFPGATAGRYVQYRLTASRASTFDNLYLSGIQFSVNVRKTVLPSSLMRHNKCVNLGVVDYPERSGMRIIY